MKKSIGVLALTAGLLLSQPTLAQSQYNSVEGQQTALIGWVCVIVIAGVLTCKSKKAH